MAGRVAIVTGSNKGIGYEIARKLLAQGFHVVMACRSTARGQEAAAVLKREVGSTSVDVRELDISKKESIARFADGIARDYAALHVLVNNAAIAFQRSDPTPFSQQARPTLNTNLTGTILLTEALLPLLRKSPDPRVVNVASMLGGLRLLDASPSLKAQVTSSALTIGQIHALAASYVEAAEAGTHTQNGWPNSSYSVSKLLLIAYTRVLARQEPAMRVNSCCPGYCDTDLTSHLGHKTAEDGARTPALLATAENLPTGRFFSEMREATW